MNGVMPETEDPAIILRQMAGRIMSMRRLPWYNCWSRSNIKWKRIEKNEEFAWSNFLNKVKDLPYVNDEESWDAVVDSLFEAGVSHDQLTGLVSSDNPDLVAYLNDHKTRCQGILDSCGF